MIKRLRLKNFRRYEDETFELGAGVSFIEGQNNAGKTTLFYAIEYALFGPFPPFKSALQLMRPGARGMGVELVFTARDGHDYRLQRIHVMPPRARSKVEGHFTLKQRRAGEETERYVLSSDFQDHEEALALALRELLGLSKRSFELAVHVRQGEITSMLQGDPKLDIVLGVTAAVTADDELRAMALEHEKEAANLPVIEASLERVEQEQARRGGETEALRKRLAAAAIERQALEKAEAAIAQLAAIRAPLAERAAVLADAAAAARDARRRRDEDAARLAARIAKVGSPEAVARRADEIEASLAALDREVAAITTEVESIREARRSLDQQRGDREGRIARRASLPTGEGARCETCGQRIDTEKSAAELAAWRRELAEIDAEIAARTAAITGAEERLEAAEKQRREQAIELASLRRSREEIDDLAAAQQQADARAADANTALVRAAGEALSTYAELRATTADVPSAPAFQLDPPAENPADAASAEAWLAALQTELRRVDDAQREAAIQARMELRAKREIEERAQAELESLEGHAAEMERERARLKTEVASLRKKRDLAARFRTLSQAFKELTFALRDRAAAELARDTLGLHRKLSTDAEELTALAIDPTRYSVNVTPADVGEEVPAAAYQGGGHKLLLGLAFKLAVARMVGPCPFLLLDEPTYGLDAARRASLLDRVADLGLTQQMLLITHQEIGNVPGRRIEVIRKGNTSVQRAREEAK